MHKFLLVLLGSVLFGSFSNANQCSDLLSTPPSAPEVSMFDDIQSIEELLTRFRQEDEQVLRAFAKTDRLNSWYRARTWFRNSLGVGAKRLDSDSASKLLQLKEAVRRGDKDQVWALVDGPFLKAESAFFQLYIVRKQIAQIRLSQGDARLGIRAWTEVSRKTAQGKAHLKELIKQFKVYESLRLFLDYEAKQGNNGRSDLAQFILDRVGIYHTSLSEYEDLRNELERVFPNGFTLGDMRDEISGEDYEEGVKRPFADFGRWHKLRSETLALGKMWLGSMSIGLIPSLTKILDGAGQWMRTVPGVRYGAPIIELFTKALNDVEAINFHLVDMMSVEGVYSLERPDQLSSVMSEYGNRGSMAFLTNMARSFEHRKLLWEIVARLVLTESGQIHLLETYLQQRTAVDDLRLEISILSKEKDLIRSGRSYNRRTEEELVALLNEKIEELRELEVNGPEGGEDEDTRGLSELIGEINKAVDEVMEGLLDRRSSESRIIGPYMLALKIRQAQERALDMPPLSYNLTTGRVAQDFMANAFLYSVTAFTLNQFAPEEVRNAFWDAILASFSGQ